PLMYTLLFLERLKRLARCFIKLSICMLVEPRLKGSIGGTNKTRDAIWSREFRVLCSEMVIACLTNSISLVFMRQYTLSEPAAHSFCVCNCGFPKFVAGTNLRSMP